MGYTGPGGFTGYSGYTGYTGPVATESVTVLNFQGPTSAVSGPGTLYSDTLPGGTVSSGQAIRVTVGVYDPNANGTYLFYLNGVNATTGFSFGMGRYITCGLFRLHVLYASSTTGYGIGESAGQSPGGASISGLAWGSNQNLVFEVTNSQTITPWFFCAELL